ncbi:SlyX family protein [Leeia sp. TBRC 13508]|uniref:SlyX family protein n=1 Tax=Leeia speluncae TaxID=2884804 RepID=A0ABS8D5Q9_9NEIS|nr:SlyX family protein [Leeia speluncae]MCB6183462.1 SlyX family protein [Leeia speluncae]
MEQDLQTRIENLEIKFSHQDDLLDTLNTIVAKQQMQIDLLSRQLLLVADQLRQQEPHRPLNPVDEIPPHY